MEKNSRSRISSSSKITTTIVMADLPEEIMFDIFSRVPTKCAGKCRCLSKSWNAHLSTSKFINLHLKNRITYNQENKNILLLTPINNIIRIITSLLKNDVSVVTKQIQSPPNTLWLSVVCSCNGLFLLSNNDNKMFLVNPITLQQAKLPYRKKSDTIDVFGFGYDPSYDDYKVVKLSWAGGKIIESFSVYSIRRRVWKKLDNVPCHLFPTHPYYPMAFMNGAVHWLTMIEGRSIIIGFDLEYEVFREIPLSVDSRKFGLSRIRILVLGEYMCIIVHDFIDSRIDMWMLKEYGKVESWVRYWIQTNDSRMMVKPLYFVSDDELLYLNDAGALILHNLKEQTTKDVVVGGVVGYLGSVSVFVDSLVSLDQYVVSNE